MNRSILLLVALATLAPPGSRAAPDNVIPVNPGVLRVIVDYPGLITRSQGAEGGFYQLNPGQGDLYNGGWMIFSTSGIALNSSGSYGRDRIEVPVAIELTRSQVANVPRAVLDSFGVVVRLTQAPRANPFVSSLRHVSSAAFRLGAAISSFREGTHVHRITVRPRWLDTQVVNIEVRIVPYLGATTDPTAYVKNLPSSLRMHRDLASFDREDRPYLVPIAIIGRPPGDRSTGQFSTTSRSGVSLRISEGTSVSTAFQESYGFPPFVENGPTFTTHRADSQGLFQELRFALQTAWQTHGSSGQPGLDDVIVCLKYPSVKQYRVHQDHDFRLTPEAPTFVSFPMRELLASNSRLLEVNNLTPDERRALIALNPLLTDPRARLPEPRFVKLATQIFTGSAVQGSVTSALVNQKVTEMIQRRGTIERNDFSVTLPFGAIASAAGASIPDTFDPFYRSSETTTREIELRTDTSTLQAGEIEFNYTIADSDPNKVVRVEIYYDTYFRTLLFRDATPQTPTRLLWSHEQGDSSLWVLDRSDSYQSHQMLANPDRARLRAAGLAQDRDGTVHVLWAGLGQAAIIETRSPGGRVIATRRYGPYSGWTATAYRRLADGTARLLWSYPASGRAALWQIDADGNPIWSRWRSYRISAGWRSSGYDLLADGSARLLWSHDDGSARVWRLDSSGNHVSEQSLGRYSGWRATSYQALADGTARILWSHPVSGWASIWTVDGSDRLLGRTSPYGTAGWSAVSYAR